VRDTVGRRLDALSPDCNELLRTAAVIGREFSVPLLSDASGTPRETVLERLAEAFAAGIVVEEGEIPGRCAFAHALVRQTLYEETPAPRRVQLHRRVVEGLRAASRTLPRPPVSELAHHSYEALPGGGVDEAVEWSLAAAEAAHERVAYDESARCYERALEALDFARPRDEARRAELLVALGEERWTGGEREAGRARLAEAADLARHLGRRDLFARAAIAYRGFGEMGMTPDAKTLALLEEALETLGAEHPVLRARLLARLAGTPPHSLSMSRRRELASEAAALASGSDERAALVDAIGARYWAALGPDGCDERLCVAGDAHALAARTGDRRLALLAHEIALAARLLRGEIAAADAEIADFERKAEESREPVFRFLAGMIRAGRALSGGDFAGAEAWMQTALQRGRGTVPHADGVFAGQQLLLFHLRGELERVAERVLAGSDGIAERFAGTGSLQRAIEILSLLRLHRRDEALERWSAFGARDFLDLEHDENWLFTVQSLAGVASELGDRRRGEILYGALRPYARLMVSHDLVRVVTATVEGVQGELALLCDRPQAAIEHAERAEARARAAGLQPALGHAQAVLCLALRRRGQRGDRARAGRLLAEVEARGPSLALRMLGEARAAAPKGS
jgi:tetratricopeptide (TPR) repeat protein